MTTHDDGGWVHGGCHCGAVRFRARLSEGLASARRCDCSYCAMRGAIAVTAPVDGFVIERGDRALTRYRFNTGVAVHHFCSRCGIHTHHRRRSAPDQYGVNAACLDGVGPFDFACVVVNDGRTHPRDRPDGRTGIAGHLRFLPATRHD